MVPTATERCCSRARRSGRQGIAVDGSRLPGGRASLSRSRPWMAASQPRGRCLGRGSYQLTEQWQTSCQSLTLVYRDYRPGCLLQRAQHDAVAPHENCLVFRSCVACRTLAGVLRRDISRDRRKVFVALLTETFPSTPRLDGRRGAGSGMDSPRRRRFDSDGDSDSTAIAIRWQ